VVAKRFAGCSVANEIEVVAPTDGEMVARGFVGCTVASGIAVVTPTVGKEVDNGLVGCQVVRLVEDERVGEKLEAFDGVPGTGISEAKNVIFSCESGIVVAFNEGDGLSVAFGNGGASVAATGIKVSAFAEGVTVERLPLPEIQGGTTF